MSSEDQGSASRGSNDFEPREAAIDRALAAEHNQSRNDLYWNVWGGEDGFIRWTGYDDDYWWDKVSEADHTRTRVGKVTGRKFVINFANGVVTVSDPENRP